MRAELVLLGRHIDMASRAHRRALVVSIYAAFALLMSLFWMLDHWRVTGVYMIFATILINRLVLGGYNTGGLIKPFNGKAPRSANVPPPFLLLALRMYEPSLGNAAYANDERELRQRDRAHYSAYQALAVSLALLWLIADWKLTAPRLFNWIPVSADTLLYGFVLAAVVVAQTLPQAILLWTEPDMDPSF